MHENLYYDLAYKMVHQMERLLHGCSIFATWMVIILFDLQFLSFGSLTAAPTVLLQTQKVKATCCSPAVPLSASGFGHGCTLDEDL